METQNENEAQRIVEEAEGLTFENDPHAQTELNLKGLLTNPRNQYCAKCKYKWASRSKKLFVSCPNCAQKVRVQK